MADKTPVRVVFDSNNVATGLGEFQSGETVGTSFGGTGLSSIGSAGQILRVNAAGNGLEFANQGDVDVLASVDSAAVQVNDNLNISGALFVNDAISSNSTVTATALNIGDAEMSETDLEKLDGITNGTVAANKAVVVDGNKDAGSFRNITATGTITTATLDVNSIESTDSTAVRINEGLDVVGTLQVNNIESLDSTQVIVNDIRVQNITANDSTAIQIDDATNFNGAVQVNSTITATGNIETSGSLVIGSASMNEADLEQLDGLTAGTVAASKAASAVVVETISSSDSTSVFFNDGITLSGPIKSDASSQINIDDALDVEGAITSGAITSSGSITAGSSFIIGSADINETDLEKLDGITNGTVSASKAVVVDSDKDIDGFRNITATGNIQVGGDLTVSGTTTSVNTTNLEISDALLELNKNNSGGADVDAGILIQRGSAGNNAAFYFNEGADRFKAVLTNSNATATAITDSSFATINQGGLVFGSESVVVTSIKDEDDMTSNSNTALATQQSIKAYVDAETASIVTTIGISDSSSNASTLTLGTNDLEFRAGNSITPTVAGTGVTFALNDDITVDQIGAKDSSGISITSPLQLSSTLQVAGTVTSNTTPTDNNHLATIGFVNDNFGKVGFPNSTTSTFPTTDDSTATDFHEGSEAVGSVSTTDAFAVPIVTIFDCMEPRGSVPTATDFGSSESHVGA